MASFVTWCNQQISIIITRVKLWKSVDHRKSKDGNDDKDDDADDDMEEEEEKCSRRKQSVVSFFLHLIIVLPALSNL